MPKPPWKLVQLKSILGDGSTSGRPKEVGCLYAERSPGTYGPLKDLEVKRGCADAKLLEAEGVDLPKNIERHTWMWHADSGYIRPAIREPGRIYCLDKGKSNVCACANEQCAFQVQEAIRGHVLLNSVHSCILLIFIQKTAGGPGVLPFPHCTLIANGNSRWALWHTACERLQSYHRVAEVGHEGHQACRSGTW